MAATDRPWHALPTDEVLQHLESNRQGLTSEVARHRLTVHGRNHLPTAPRRPAWQRLLAQIHNVLIYVLLLAIGITAVMGHWVDSGVILAVVVINVLIGFWQEGKAEESLEAIMNMLTDNALVERNGRRVQIPAAELVPGDVVFVQSGDRIPADVRFLHCRQLRVEEAALTGESVPVDKNTNAVAADAVLGDRTGSGFSGTFVTSGQGTGVVVATGLHTELGRISGMLADVTMLRTPLLDQIDRFARHTSLGVLVLALATFAFGWGVRDFSVGEMFLVTVGVAVAAIPEGLPAILSITLAIGVQRMAKHNAIIRRLPAVDTLGAVDVICTDKTGTLTRNEMMITDLWLPTGAVQVDGSGYAPTGGFRRAEATLPAEEVAGLNNLAQCAVLCNDARLDHQDGLWRPVGDPIEAALLALAGKAGVVSDVEAGQLPRADVIPFESEHRFMATLHHVHSGGAVILLKGAPEVVIDRCATVGGQPLNRDEWMPRIDGLARQGRRVLALAAKRLPEAPTELTFDHVSEGLDLLGLVGAIDPPREEAIAAVAECQEAGIRVKMITGDHGATAEAIARELGIGHGQPALTGVAIDALDEPALVHAVDTSDVFARVSPEHKLRIVQALQSNGRTIAMTGDGVNDAPALKRAHIGVAMGDRGTEVAKQAADMVLADDNFASIAVAVREGRTVFDNLRKAILFILPTNGGQVMVILTALVLGMNLPLTPVQILWVNLVTAVTLALALAFEPGERDLMKRPPRPTNAPLLPALFLWRIALVSVLMSAGSLGIYVWLESLSRSIDEARTAAVTTLVAIEVLYLFNTRSISGPALGRNRPPANRWVWVAVGTMIVLQLLYIYLPWSQKLFHTTALDGLTWAVILLMAGATFTIVEVEKLVLRVMEAGHRLQATDHSRR